MAVKKDPNKIDPDTRVSEIIHHYPETRSIFISCGLGALVSDEGMRVLSPFLTLGTALKSRFVNQGQFMEMLGEALAKGPVLEAPGLESFAAQRDLTLLGLMPCGLKMPFSRAFSTFMSDLEQGDGPRIRYAVEGNLNQELSYYTYVDGVERIEELPDIIVSADFNTFYSHRFYDRFVAPGLLTGYGNAETAQSFKAAGIIDPKGEYTILCINPLVIVANLDQLKGRSLPRTWEDALDPVWANDLAIRGGDNFFCHAVLLPVFQQFGAPGLERLAHNLFKGLHPSQMVNRIDKNQPCALYVMPEFFARRVRHQDRIQVVWPEDGALASPVTLQVKPERNEQLKPVLDYLTGQDLAQVLARAGFPVPRADVAAGVQTRPLRWLGWEYLRRHDLVSLNREIDEIFMPLVSRPKR